MYRNQKISNRILFLDHESCLGFPLKGSPENAIEFYEAYMETTNRLWNPFTSGTTRYESYLDGNFMIAVNLEQLGITEGLLQARIRFPEVQEASELSLLWVPLTTKTLKIDRLGEVNVE